MEVQTSHVRHVQKIQIVAPAATYALATEAGVCAVLHALMIPRAERVIGALDSSMTQIYSIFRNNAFDAIMSVNKRLVSKG